MIVQHVITNSSNRDNKYSNHNSNKGDITPVTKAVARKFILMQITRARVANTFH